MHYVTTHGLTKRFGSVTVFDGLNMSINKGEFVTLLGPSGCGKSTLLRCLSGLTPINGGRISVGGDDITAVKPQNRGIGMVFQSYALFPNMTVRANIAFGLKMKRIAGSEATRRVAEAVALVELGGHEDKYPHELSGGQRQRVALARALVVHPRILLLDEPLSALDARIRRNLRKQIRSIQRELGLTTIFVTHDQEEALTLSDRIFLMDRGDIVQSGSAESIYTDPANAFVAGFIGNSNLLTAQQAKALLGMDITGLLAVRPESIYVREPGRNYALGVSTPVEATVLSHQLLGNVIRYQLLSRGCELTVDLLNRSSSRLFEAGTELEILFNRNELREVA